ncbi:MAG: ribonuclease Z [Candidatus Thermoplasmatota archaeon]|jgi:ribonuclease Z|nr:ribonuclease Z [Candidatus Thermoplasmatota archaeon]
MASLFRIIFLGTGGSWPTPGRSMPSILLQIDDTISLLDCGEGTQKQIMKSGVSFMKIKHVLLSHLHGDHFLGLIGLIQSMSFNGRTDELNIYGPPGCISILSRAINVGYYTLRFPIKVHEIPFESSMEIEGFMVETIRADHPVPAVSYKIIEKDLVKIDPEKARRLNISSRRLEELRRKGSIDHDGKIVSMPEVYGGTRKGRILVYSGDTRPNPQMEKFAINADILIHETSTSSSLEPKVNEFGHSSSRQAAEIARNACVKKFYLFHYSPRIDNTLELLNEAKDIFPESYLSTEGLSVDIEKGNIVFEKND